MRWSNNFRSEGCCRRLMTRKVRTELDRQVMLGIKPNRCRVPTGRLGPQCC